MYTVKGLVKTNVEISGEDALTVAFEIWKESVGRKGWACLGSRWAITGDDVMGCTKYTPCTDSEKSVDKLFDDLFEFLRNKDQQGETK